MKVWVFQCPNGALALGRWPLGLRPFSKNRDRLLAGDIATKFLSAVMAQPKVKTLLSTDHFSVGGTLIEVWASMKSVKPKSPPSGEDLENGSGVPPAGGGPQCGGGFPRSEADHRSRRQALPQGEVDVAEWFVDRTWGDLPSLSR